MVECHPHNIGAAVFSSFIGAHWDANRIEPPLSEIFSKLSGGADISEAINDRLQQHYRTGFVPGIDNVLQVNYDGYTGLLGSCLSGAGPSIVPLATHNLEIKAQAIIKKLSEAQDIHCNWQILELAPDGANCDTSM